MHTTSSVSTFDRVLEELSFLCGQPVPHWNGVPDIDRRHRLYVAPTKYAGFRFIWGRCPAGRRFLAFQYSAWHGFWNYSQLLFERDDKRLAPGSWYHFTAIHKAAETNVGHVECNILIAALHEKFGHEGDAA